MIVVTILAFKYKDASENSQYHFQDHRAKNDKININTLDCLRVKKTNKQETTMFSGYLR